MRLRFLVTILLFPLAIYAEPVLSDIQRLDSLRRAFVANPFSCRDIVMKADAHLGKACYTVMDKVKTRSGDKHNYESMAVYYWPDPQNPTGVYKVKDGKTNPEYSNYDGSKLFGLTYATNDLIEAYYVTRDERYAQKCRDMIKCWFLDKATYMYPNMEYGQFIPGASWNGNVGGISEAICFTDILDNVEILLMMNQLDKKAYKNLKKWFVQYAQWMQSSSVGAATRNVDDNIGVMYDILLYRICIFIGEKDVRRQILSDFDSVRIGKQLALDGSQPRELKRTKAMMYSIYNLKHVVEFCRMAKLDGVDYYNQHRERIDAAFGFIERYIDNQKSFPYKEIGDWSLYQRQFAELKKQYAALRAGVEGGTDTAKPEMNTAEPEKNTAAPVNPMALPSINVNQLK